MKKALLLLVLALSTSAVQAQYSKALGLKVNHYKAAINYKIFLTDSTNTVLDLELGFQETGLEFIGLFNWQVPFAKSNQLFWYYGIGANIGRWENGIITFVSLGIDAQIGIEYVPSEIPIAFSFDYTPNFSFSNAHDDYSGRSSWGSGFWKENWAMGIKYTFGD